MLVVAPSKLLLLLVSLLLAASTTTTTSLYCLAQTSNDRPNVIQILADDLGFGDLRSYGHPYALTPNLDRLAAEGTSFKQFHVNGNVCQPTRAGLMTGRNPTSFPNYCPDYGFLNATTITNLLKTVGYRTGHVGKWNIGPDRETDAVLYGVDDVRVAKEIENDPRGREGARFDAAIDFIQLNQNSPFYLNIWVWTPHAPIDPPVSFEEPFANLTVNRSDFGFWMQQKFDIVGDQSSIDSAMRTYLADIYSLDIQVGRLLDALDEMNLADNTIVVFTSDNGPERQRQGPQYLGYSGGLRGEKHSFYEGGTRVPFIVRWPGRVPAGVVNDVSITFGLDWLPTIATLAGVESIPWDHIEGEDVSDIWLGESPTRSRTNPLLFSTWTSRRIMAVRYGRWKYYIQTYNNVTGLYDLETDPEERVDLFATLPSVAAAMNATLYEWVATLPTGHARLPAEPLPFDATEPVTVIGPPEELVDFMPTLAPAGETPNCDAVAEAYLTCFQTNSVPCEGQCSVLRVSDPSLDECASIDAFWCDFNDCCCPVEGRAYYECLLPAYCTPCATLPGDVDPPTPSPTDDTTTTSGQKAAATFGSTATRLFAWLGGFMVWLLYVS